MRALLDTNIIIHRENTIVTSKTIGQLFYWLDKLHYEKLNNEAEIHFYNECKIEKFDNLKECFNYAVNTAKPNDTILLSPATASYDQYSSYIERGKHFDNLVKDYITNQ